MTRDLPHRLYARSRAGARACLLWAASLLVISALTADPIVIAAGVLLACPLARRAMRLADAMSRAAVLEERSHQLVIARAVRQLAWRDGAAMAFAHSRRRVVDGTVHTNIARLVHVPLFSPERETKGNKAS